MLDVPKASPIEWVPEAQAETVVVQMPFAPTRNAMLPATIFTIDIGTNIGDTRFAPLSCIRITWS